MQAKRAAFYLAVSGVLALASCSELPPVPQVERPETAPQVQLSGVENLYRIGEDLYRGGQPDEAGFSALEKLGVRSVLNLRVYHKDTHKARHTGLHLMEYPVSGGSVTEADVEACLRMIREAPKPVFVHCWHGSNRTGIVVAAYRIVFQGWSVEAAENELRDETYGYREFWYGNLVKLLRGTDWAAMRSRLSVDDTPGSR